MTDRTYAIAPDPDDNNRVIVTELSGRRRRIHREDADPEHRHLSIRLAAAWFGNDPA